MLPFDLDQFTDSGSSTGQEPHCKIPFHIPIFFQIVSKLFIKYSLQGTTQGRYLTGGVPPVRFSM